MQQLDLESHDFEVRAVSPFFELGAYEALWNRAGASFKNLAEKFSALPGSLPSDFVSPDEAREFARLAHDALLGAGVESYGVRVNGAGDYPRRLRDAKNPLQLVYYQGWWELVKRWSQEFGPVVKVDRLMRKTIQYEDTKEPFARFQSQGCA